MIPPKTHRPMLAQRHRHTHTHVYIPHDPHTHSPRYVHTGDSSGQARAPLPVCVLCECAPVCVLLCEYVPVCATVYVCVSMRECTWAKEEREGKSSSGSSV